MKIKCVHQLVTHLDVSQHKKFLDHIAQNGYNGHKVGWELVGWPSNVKEDCWIYKLTEYEDD